MVDPTQEYGLVTSVHGLLINPASLSAVGAHVLKVGAGGGDVSFTHTGSFVELFGTELAITDTIPTGNLAIALAFFSCGGPNSNNLYAGISIDSAAPANGLALVGGNSSYNWPVALMALLVGDGASHTFDVVGQVSGGTATLKDSTASGNFLPQHLLLVIPAT